MGTRRVAAELIGDLGLVYQRMKAANRELSDLVGATGTRLLDLPGIGASGAARLAALTPARPTHSQRRTRRA